MTKAQIDAVYIGIQRTDRPTGEVTRRRRRSMACSSSSSSSGRCIGECLVSWRRCIKVSGW